MKEFAPFKAPMLGAAYYPEAWDEKEQEHDIAYMQKAGITVVRMTEFAWHRMEPADGQFDFAWLHRVMDKLRNAGIAMVLGTPSATPPTWVEKKDPSMHRLCKDGQRESHGARRHCCSNNATYRFYSARIAERMAQEFGDDDNVVGWQIDNEIAAHDGHFCYCETCSAKFADYLKARYGTVENMNNRWDTNLWSQWYDDFDEVPNTATAWHNPHLRYEWHRFQSESHIDFIKMQADILHRYTKAPVGTDVMPVFWEDHEKLAEFLDIVQFNHYESADYLWHPQMWFDHMRTLKDRPFWCTETSGCWAGGREVAPNRLQPEGFCRANSWMPVVLGGEANMYWLWRQQRAGHELMHGAVLYASGRPMHTFGEIQEVSAGFKKGGEFLSGTKVTTDVAFMVSARADRQMFYQPVYAEPDADRDTTGSYIRRIWPMYHEITRHGIHPDVIGVNKPLDNYKLLITPFMLTLEEGGLPQRIDEFVKNGGVWLVGPLTDVRDDIGAHYTDRETGMLEAMTGAVLSQQVPDPRHQIELNWNSGDEFRGNRWFQLYDLPPKVESLATVTGGIFPALNGKSALFKVPYGKGCIIVLGTIPDTPDYHRVLDLALEISGAQHTEIEGELIVARREGAYSGYALLEHGGMAASAVLPGRFRDRLTDEICGGKVTVNPYQVRLLQRIDE